MGAGLSEAFKDITEQGNRWPQDVALPSAAEVLSRDTFIDARRPAFSGQLKRVLSGVETDVGDCRQSSEESGSDGSQPSTPARSPRPDAASSSTPSRRHAPEQVVLAASRSRAEHSKLLRTRIWLPLHEVAVLRSRTLFSQERVRQLEDLLPIAVQFAASWQLIYSPRVHGISLRNFYRHCKEWPGPTLLLVEDTEGVVFGGFVSERWSPQRLQLPYGRPDSFVFSFGSHKDHRDVRLHAWSGANNHFMFADQHGISMGGGTRGPAFWICKDFLKGTSAPSETFGTAAPLASAGEFVIRHFECWRSDCASGALLEEAHGSSATSVGLVAGLDESALEERGPAGNLRKALAELRT